MNVHQRALNHEFPAKARFLFAFWRARTALDTPWKTPESALAAISARCLLNQLMLNGHLKTVNLPPEEPTV
jgi:hypothetical protein